MPRWSRFHLTRTLATNWRQLVGPKVGPLSLRTGQCAFTKCPLRHVHEQACGRFKALTVTCLAVNSFSIVMADRFLTRSVRLTKKVMDGEF